MDNNEALREELLALEKHVYTLDNQNAALFLELEKFATTDDVIKNTLDKRGRVKELKENFNKELQRSELNVRMKSPSRR